MLVKKEKCSLKKRSELKRGFLVGGAGSGRDKANHQKVIRL